MSTSVPISTDPFKEFLESRQQQQSTSGKLGNLFQTNKISGFFYQPLRTDEEGTSDGGTANGTSGSRWTFWSQHPSEQESSWCPSLSRTQRLIGFGMCVLMGSICFVLSGFYLPMLIFKARKFCLLFTLGSVFVMSSFSMLWGPWSHLTHLFSKERLPFTLAYLGSLSATLYSALVIQSAILTTMCAIIQIVALVWYLISYLPGGTAGLKMMSSFALKGASRTLPV